MVPVGRYQVSKDDSPVALDADIHRPQSPESQGREIFVSCLGRWRVNKNQITVMIKSQSGGTWPDAMFNLHQLVQHVLDKAMETFHLDARQSYEVLLVQGAIQRSLQLGESLADAGVRDGDLLLIRTIGRTVDGAHCRA